MSDRRRPWDQDESPAPQPNRPTEPSSNGRPWWLLYLVAMGGGLWLLFQAFPGALHTPQDWMWLVGGGAWLTFLIAGNRPRGRAEWRQGLRNAGIWVGIIAVLVIGVTYRAELADGAQRLRMALSFSYPVATNPHELVITQSGDGSFYVMGKVNGQLVRFVVDTGASETVLSPADAKRLGIDISGLVFDQVSETANGEGHGANYTADSLAIGNIGFMNMPMTINQAQMSSSLLGMTFLRKLESFQVKGDRLYLRSRD